MTNDRAGALELSEAALRAKALTMLSEFQRLAALPDASREARIQAETAGLIVEIAQLTARTIPAEWVAADLAAFKRWSGARLRALECAVAATTDSRERSALVACAMEELEVVQRRVLQSLNLRSWDGWNQACTRLDDLCS